MSEELKPCPFCGSQKVQVSQRLFANGSYKQTYVKCLVCEASGPAVGSRPETNTEENAKNNWNNVRVLQSYLEAEADWLATEIGECNTPEFPFCNMVEGKCRDCWREIARKEVRENVQNT